MPDVKPITSEQVAPKLVPRPTALPARADYIKGMLDQTQRPGVPIRRNFVQLPEPDANGSRHSTLSKLVKSRSDKTLDAFLLIHALASSSKPYDVWYPAQSWARALGLDSSTGASTDDGMPAAKAAWSKTVGKLVDMKLIRRQRGAKNKMSYVLANESGDGTDYTRPLDRQDGGWFTLPHIYWTGDYYRTLDLPAKAMLLIALSLKNTFTLPAARVPEWYGISESTAKRGFKQLEEAHIITWEQSWRADPRSPTGWAEERTYRLLSPWTQSERAAAMKRRAAKTPVFVDPDAGDEGNEPDSAASVIEESPEGNERSPEASVTAPP
jgi:hypothetical protein